MLVLTVVDRRPYVEICGNNHFVMERDTRVMMKQSLMMPEGLTVNFEFLSRTKKCHTS